jgi:murein DD-endopeptidase MepM/ murein hydrolase activator NlpD
MNAKTASPVFWLLSLLTVLGTDLPAAAALELELQPACARQGETVKVVLRQPLPAPDAAVQDRTLPEVHFGKKTYSAFLLPTRAADGRLWRALIGVPADLSPGDYVVKAEGQEKTLKVLDSSFGVQVLRLPAGKDNFDSSPGEVEAVDAAKARLSPEQYWQGKFLRPSKARISSPFGLRRRVNGVLLKDYFHSGLDFAGSAGSPVLATQSGKVSLAHRGWKLHGNIVSIDHGQGVVSFYIHLSRIYVKEGELVKAGQKIGAVGATGRASGPHLHFSLYVNRDATNPMNWFSKSY